MLCYVSALLLDDTLLKCVVKEVVLFSQGSVSAMRSPQLKNVEDIKNRRIGHQRELP